MTRGKGWGITGFHVLVVLGGTATIIGVASALVWLLNGRDWTPVGNWLHKFSTGAAVGGTLAVASAVLAVLAANRKLEHDRLNHLHERYTEAATQIGDDKPAIRLAGVYAMAALVDEWLTVKQDTRDAQACVDVLCSYLRMDLRVPETPDVPQADESSTREEQQAKAARQKAYEQEGEVRHAIIGLIQKRKWEERSIKVNLRSADLSHADLSHADLRGANLSHADLRGANLSHADLTDADLMGANLTGADLWFVNLRSAYLTDANLTDASLMGANLRRADLMDANLRRADLMDANLMGAYLWSANLTDADLRGADLMGADLTDANLTDANLTDAKMSAPTQEG